MFVKRKWARMDRDFKLYIKISAVVLVSIFGLSLYSWRRKGSRMLQEKAKPLVHKIKEQIQQGISKDLVIDTVNSSIPSLKDPKQLLKMLESEMKNALGFPPAAITEKERPNESANVLLLSSAKSGGVFLGQLLNDIFPDTFYIFNPLFLTSYSQTRQQIPDDASIDKVIAKLRYKNAVSGLVKDIFSCDFITSPLTQAFAYELKESYSFATANTNSMKFCSKLKLKMEICMHPTILGEICELFPKRLIMDQNLHLDDVEELLSTIEFKVIMFVRDPRAVANSRRNFQRCHSKNKDVCVDVPKLCEQLNTDTDTAMKFGKKYSKKIILLRYEDFCLDPYGTLDRLVDFLNYKPIPKLINNHVEFYTGRTRSGEQIEIPKSDHNDPMGTVRNSAVKPFEWRTNISKPLLQKVEEHCEKTMRKLGYAKWNLDKHQTLDKSVSEVWPFT